MSKARTGNGKYQNAFGQYSDPQSSPDYNTFYACTTAPVNTD